MTSSDDAFRALEGWKASGSPLYVEFVPPEGPGELIPLATIAGLTEDGLVLRSVMSERRFDLSGAVLSIDMNVPQRFRNLLTETVDIRLADGGHVVLSKHASL
jgi:hypothetical protein